eukprot:4250363-Amphidinium_carterae.1
MTRARFLSMFLSSRAQPWMPSCDLLRYYASPECSTDEYLPKCYSANSIECTILVTIPLSGIHSIWFQSCHAVAAIYAKSRVNPMRPCCWVRLPDVPPTLADVSEAPGYLWAVPQAPAQPSARLNNE